MARTRSDATEPPQPAANAQTKIIVAAIDELQQAIAALSNGLIEFSGRFDKRFPGQLHLRGASGGDFVRAQRVLPLIYQLLQDKAFSCVSLKNSALAAQHESLAEALDEFKNNKRLGNFFSRIEGHAIDNGLAIERLSAMGDTPQLWKVCVSKRLQT